MRQVAQYHMDKPGVESYARVITSLASFLGPHTF